MLVLKMKLFGNGEKGIAILFTLIVLSLLLILALGFALNSMFDHKAAYNSANKSFAAFLAQTQLKQVLTLIENDEANLENSKFYSHDSGSPVVTDTNMLKDMLQERLKVADLLTTIDTDKVNWNYIRSQDSEKRIIGRTAFIVLTGIPLDSLVDGRVGTTAYPKHDEKDNTETRIGKYVSEINVRAALPSATSSIAGALNWNGDSADNTVQGFTEGKYTGNWQSFTNLFSTLEAVPITLTDPQKAEFRDNVSIVVAKDKEAFWMDTSIDTNIDSDELYKRFDLTRDWNTADNAADLTFIKEKILLTSGTAPDVDMEKWTDSDSGSASAGLPWLACFGYKDDGSPYTLAELNSTFSSVSAHRYQIAANLKDYCDDDGGINRPTSDVDPATWYNHISTSVAPLFTGNEKTPYLNKIGVKITASSIVTGTYDTTAKIEIKPLVGLVNIYGASCPDDLKVRIIGKVTVSCKIDSVTKILNTDPSTATDSIINFNTVVDVNGTGNASPNWPNNDGYSHFLEGAVTTATTLSVTTASAASVEIKVTALTVDKVILYDATNNSKGYDYVKNLAVVDLPFMVISSSSGTTENQISWYGLEVNDPRQNLNTRDWVQYSPSTVDAQHVFSLDASDDTVCKPNADNANTVYGAVARVAPKDGDDPEGVVTDPANANISTAYIRNAPMESPWELGFIHRGFRWQTVNLKKYDSAKAYKAVTIGTRKYIPGGGLYSAGDANILDQIKMTHKPKSPQKVNLRSQRTAIFDALFYKIRLGCDIDANMSVDSMAGLIPSTGAEINCSDPYYVTTTVPPVPPAGLRDAIIRWFKTPDTSTFTNLTRASIVNISTGLLNANEAEPPTIGFSSAVTDAGKEELVGKIINLTAVKGKVDSFTIIILAQMIKDVGGPTGSPISITKYSGDALTYGDQGCEVSVFNADINDISDSKKNIYYDEITAEQKIIVKGYRTIDGNIKITSFQYAE